MPLALPLLAGAAIVSAFLFGGKEREGSPLANAKAKQATPPRGKRPPPPTVEAKMKEKAAALPPEVKEAAKAAKKAADKEDWQALVANAIASGDRDVVSAALQRLKAAGQKAAYADLKKAWDQIVKTRRAREEAKKKRAKRPTPPKPAPKALPAPKRKATPKPSAPKPAPAPVAVQPTKPPGYDEAQQLMSHLETHKRYTENQVLVEDYQAHNGLYADGKYGPNTARSVWSLYGILPVNPFYWSASTASKDVAAYRAFLDSIAADKPSLASQVEALKPKVGQ